MRPKFPSLWELLARIQSGQASQEDYQMFNEIVVFKRWIATIHSIVQVREKLGGDDELH